MMMTKMVVVDDDGAMEMVMRMMYSYTTEDVSTAGAAVTTAGAAVTTAGAAVTTAGASISTASPLRVSTAKDISTTETLVYIRRSEAKDKG
ncbi:hypothetical protein Tco_0737553, partial [Tanacetum coccineum]